MYTFCIAVIVFTVRCDFSLTKCILTNKILKCFCFSNLNQKVILDCYGARPPADVLTQD